MQATEAAIQTDAVNQQQSQAPEQQPIIEAVAGDLAVPEATGVVVASGDADASAGSDPAADEAGADSAELVLDLPDEGGGEMPVIAGEDEGTATELSPEEANTELVLAEDPAVEEPLPEEVVEPEEPVEPPPPLPVQLLYWNEKLPAADGCWIFWREAGFECRGKIVKGTLTATCRGYGDSLQSQPIELLLRRRFVSQGEAIAVMNGMLSFDPRSAESLGFDITARVMLAA